MVGGRGGGGEPKLFIALIPGYLMLYVVSHGVLATYRQRYEQ